MKLLLLALFSLFLLVDITRAEDDLALPKQCEDVLSSEQCQKLRDFAAAVQVKVADLDASIREAVQSGLQQARDVYARVRASLEAKLQAKTCEDLLPAEYCERLRSFEAALKIKAADVDNAIRRAIAEGKVRVSEIYQHARQFVNDIMAIRTCEDVMPADKCAKIRNAAATAKARIEEVNQAIRDAIARGKVKAEEIYQDALEFFRSRVLSKTCEDVISPEACAKLRKLAVNLREKAELVDEYVRRAVVNGYKEASAVHQKVEEYFESLANAKTCDDVLPGETCDKLRELAERLRVGRERATEAVRAAFKKGYQQLTSVTASAIENVKNFATNTECEDVISAQACQKLRDTAAKVKVAAGKVNEAVRDAVAKSIFFGKDVMERARAYLRDNISCEKVLGAGTCAKIQKVASSIGVAAEETERVIKDNIMKGMNRLSEVYAAVLKFFQDKVWGKLKEWVPRFGKRDLEKRDISEWVAGAKAKVQEAVEKAKELLAQARIEAMEALQGAKGKVKELVTEAIRLGKANLNQLEEFVRQLMEKYGADGDELKMVKRSFIDDLREAAKKAKGVLREVIEKALTKGGESLNKMRGVLETVINLVLGRQQKREMEEDIKIMADILEAATKRETEEIAARSILDADALLDEAFEDIEDLADDIDDHSSSKKREVESDLFMRLRESLDALSNNL